MHFIIKKDLMLQLHTLVSTQSPVKLQCVCVTLGLSSALRCHPLVDLALLHSICLPGCWSCSVILIIRQPVLYVVKLLLSEVVNEYGIYTKTLLSS